MVTDDSSSAVGTYGKLSGFPSERLSDSSKVTQLINDHSGIKSRFPKCYHYATLHLTC